MATSTNYVGRAMKRKEDPRLIQGIAHYVDDIKLADMLHLAVVRSPHAHAMIRSVDVSKARGAAGVAAVITGEDLRGVIALVPCAIALPDMKPAFRPVLAYDRVRFVGEPVAVVVASDRYTA